MAMKRQFNNAGTVSKVSGNRAKPYRARLPYCEFWDSEKQVMVRKQRQLGYFRTENEAWKALQEYKRDHEDEFDRESKNSAARKSEATLEKLWKQFSTSSDFLALSHSSIAAYNAIWNKHLSVLAETPVKDIKTSTLSDIVNSLNTKSGIKAHIITLTRKLMNIAIADDIIDKNYADYVKVKSDEVEIERKCFTNSEIKALWDHKDEWICQIALVELYSGSRISEIVSLTAENIHLDCEIPYFHVEKGKNKFAVRDVPIHSAILGLFKELLKKNTDYLIKRNGKAISGDIVQKRSDGVPRLCEILGSQHYIYDAKHSFVTQATIKGISNLAKINIIGHTPESTSEKFYTHLPLEVLKEEIEKVTWD